jgi:hypothetical protein
MTTTKKRMEGVTDKDECAYQEMITHYPLCSVRPLKMYILSLFFLNVFSYLIIGCSDWN